ncbi:MAG TPA: hypothetical protein VEP90_03195, partial [Methylomirabilota bacterium]|nr:hypothetical protein [Methylomirabilota bacterium]
LVNIAGMSGGGLVEGYGKALQGVAAATMHQYSRFNSNPAILATMDKKLAAFGWKPGEFLEAREILNGSGIHFVSNESNTQLGYTKTNSVIKGVGQKFMDLGDVFFKEGDRHGRYSAVYAAYKEIRDANPIGRLTELDKAKILARADDFTGNMTQASKSALQMGPASIPTQFLGFSMRMTELMIGKRLTTEQKFRLFGTYWAMYGLPVAFGIYSIPQFGDMWKKSAQQAGYDPNTISVASLVNEGAPETFLKLVTQNTYNFGEKYGNPGIDALRDGFSTDKTALEIVGGASGSMLQGVIKGMDGYWKWVTTFLNGDDTAYGMTSDDFLRPLEASAAYGKYHQTLRAVNTGVWMNKNESVLKTNVGVMNALFMGISGLQPKDVDTKTLDLLMEARTEQQKEGLNSFIRNVHRARDAIKNQDPQQAKTYLNNARLDLAFSGYPQERRAQAWSTALSDKTTPERKLWNYFMTNVSPEEKAKNAEIYGNIMRNLQ